MITYTDNRIVLVGKGLGILELIQKAYFTEEREIAMCSNNKKFSKDISMHTKKRSNMFRKKISQFKESREK